MSRLFLGIALPAGILCILSGCFSVERHSSADPYVLHHPTWWNHYERGRLYMQDSAYDLAQQDFEIALGLKPGARYSYAHERWRARTYGMHMIEGYFPHRELGICFFEQGKYSKSLELLNKSIQMEPSARAKFYINLARKKLTRKPALPGIGIMPLPDSTREREIVLKGTVTGPGLIHSLIINNDSEFIELAESNLSFERTITLHEGRNTINLTATDLSGNHVATNLTLTADWTPPQIQMQRNGTTLEILCFDSGGLAMLQANGHTIRPSGTSYQLDWPTQSGTPLSMTVIDRAGNIVEWSLSKKELLEQKQPNTPPTLRLADAGKSITLYNKEYILDLRAEDDTALRSVSVNGKNLLPHPTPLFRTLYRVELEPGTNRLAVAIEDIEDNRTKEHITVVYREPEYLDQHFRLAATLSPPNGDLPDTAYGQRIKQLMSHQLTKNPVRFYLLAGEEDSRYLQDETKLSDSTLADRRALLKTGKKLNADLVFITRVINDAPGQTIYTQVLDTQSGKELFIEDIYLEDDRLMPNQLGGLVMKLEQRFPLLQAKIVMRANQLVIDAGTERGAHTGMRLLVIRSEDSFEQGHVLQTANKPTELILSNVESESAVFIMPRLPKGTVQPGDFVFTR